MTVGGRDGTPLRDDIVVLSELRNLIFEVAPERLDLEPQLLLLIDVDFAVHVLLALRLLRIRVVVRRILSHGDEEVRVLAVMLVAVVGIERHLSGRVIFARLALRFTVPDDVAASSAAGVRGLGQQVRPLLSGVAACG